MVIIAIQSLMQLFLFMRDFQNDSGFPFRLTSEKGLPTHTLGRLPGYNSRAQQWVPQWTLSFRLTIKTRVHSSLLEEHAPGTRPNISESHSEISTRVPFCIDGRAKRQASQMLTVKPRRCLGAGLRLATARVVLALVTSALALSYVVDASASGGPQQHPA